MLTPVVTTPQVDWNFVALKNSQVVKDPRAAVRVLSQQSALPGEIVQAVAALLKDLDMDGCRFGLVSAVHLPLSSNASYGLCHWVNLLDRERTEISILNLQSRLLSGWVLDNALSTVTF